MGKTLQQKIAELSQEQQDKIKARVKELIESYILKRGYTITTARDTDFIKRILQHLNSSKNIISRLILIYLFLLILINKQEK
jgi:hypothetical protein